MSAYARIRTSSISSSKTFIALPTISNCNSMPRRWLFDHGHPEEGLRWTEKILRESPQHPETNRLLADYYEKKGIAAWPTFTVSRRVIKQARGSSALLQVTHRRGECRSGDGAPSYNCRRRGLRPPILFETSAPAGTKVG